MLEVLLNSPPNEGTNQMLQLAQRIKMKEQIHLQIKNNMQTEQS